MSKTKARDKARLIANFAAGKKGDNIVLMDMTGISTMCDWFVLVSGSSSRRIHTISRTIQSELSKQRIKPSQVEGKNNPYWTLLDYDDVIVHIFHRDIREFYNLEKLWSNAPIERFDDRCHVKTLRKK